MANLRKWRSLSQTEKDEKIQDARTHNETHVQIMSRDILSYLVNQASSVKDRPLVMTRLSKTCQRCSSYFKPQLNQLNGTIAARFLKAVIDCNYGIVKQMLKANPALLLATPPTNLSIQCQGTKQYITAENAYVMAAKRRQTHMLSIMIPVLDRLIARRISTFVTRQAFTLKLNTLKYWHAYDKGVKDSHLLKCRDLVDKWINAYVTDDARVRHPRVEAAINFEAFLQLGMTPDAPIRLDDYYQVETLLKVAYKRYVERYHSLSTSHTHRIFWDNVIRPLEKNIQTKEGYTFLMVQMDNIQTATFRKALPGSELHSCAEASYRTLYSWEISKLDDVNKLLIPEQYAEKTQQQQDTSRCTIS